MKKLLLVALLLCGCGPSFSPELMAEVDTVGFVLQSSALNRGGPAGSGTGYMLVTLVDWKKQMNLGTVLVKSWKNNAPGPKDFEGAYPELAKKIKDLHK